MAKIKNFLLFDLFESTGIENEKDTIIFLNKLLSNNFILFLKIWNFHWNLLGPNWIGAHNFLNDLYDSFFEDIDNIAERIRAIGGRPVGTLKGYLDKSEIKEHDDEKEIPDIDKIYEAILEDYETIIKQIRKFITDEKVDSGTTNFLEDMIMRKEKDAWMIRSIIEKKEDVEKKDQVE